MGKWHALNCKHPCCSVRSGATRRRTASAQPCHRHVTPAVFQEESSPFDPKLRRSDGNAEELSGLSRS
jgi:hypothetical protein